MRSAAILALLCGLAIVSAWEIGRDAYLFGGIGSTGYHNADLGMDVGASDTCLFLSSGHTSDNMNPNKGPFRTAVIDSQTVSGWRDLSDYKNEIRDVTLGPTLLLANGTVLVLGDNRDDRGTPAYGSFPTDADGVITSASMVGTKYLIVTKLRCQYNIHAHSRGSGSEKLHCVGKTIANHLYVMGANEQGELGGTAATEEAYRMYGNVLDFATFYSVTLVVGQDGVIYGSGKDNGAGLLGTSHTGATVTAFTDLGFGFTDCTEVHGSADTAWAVCGGDLYAWGSNAHGQIGDTATYGTAVDTPTKMEYAVITEGTSLNIAAISGGDDFTVFRTANNPGAATGGRAYILGRTLEDASTVVTTPTLIADNDVVSVDGGVEHVALLHTDGSVTIRGNNAGHCVTGGSPGDTYATTTITREDLSVASTDSHTPPFGRVACGPYQTYLIATPSFTLNQYGAVELAHIDDLPTISPVVDGVDGLFPVTLTGIIDSTDGVQHGKAPFMVTMGISTDQHTLTWDDPNGHEVFIAFNLTEALMLAPMYGAFGVQTNEPDEGESWEYRAAVYSECGCLDEITFSVDGTCGNFDSATLSTVAIDVDGTIQCRYRLNANDGELAVPAGMFSGKMSDECTFYTQLSGGTMPTPLTTHRTYFTLTVQSTINGSPENGGHCEAGETILRAKRKEALAKSWDIFQAGTWAALRTNTSTQVQSWVDLTALYDTDTTTYFWLCVPADADLGDGEGNFVFKLDTDVHGETFFGAFNFTMPPTILTDELLALHLPPQPDGGADNYPGWISLDSFNLDDKSAIISLKGGLLQQVTGFQILPSEMAAKFHGGLVSDTLSPQGANNITFFLATEETDVNDKQLTLNFGEEVEQLSDITPGTSIEFNLAITHMSPIAVIQTNGQFMAVCAIFLIVIGGVFVVTICLAGCFIFAICVTSLGTVLASSLGAGALFVSLRRVKKRSALAAKQFKVLAKVGVDPNNPRYTAIKDYFIEKSRIHLETELARGAAGAVFRASFTPARGGTQRSVVVKMLLGNMQSIGEMLDELAVEVKALRNLHHPNIVEFIGTTIDADVSGGDFENKTRCGILTEFCNEGSLYDYVKRRHKANKPLSMRQVLTLCYDAANGLNFLHTRPQPLIHRDVKPQNVMVATHMGNVIGKVGDVGLVTVTTKGKKLETDVGTPVFLAPEVIGGRNRKTAVYGTKTDVYSFGVMLWFVATDFRNDLPYGDRNTLSMLHAVAKGERPAIPPTCPAWLADLIERSWDVNPDVRPTMKVVMETISKALAKPDTHPVWAPISSKPVNNRQ
ncbi:Protein tyrosine kinase [Carpediemonas membranifera]|uniref:Protein tyrosine kinase n=1 Tax=Carpediemonas membranifera TaxID=201153 RepID=A0A8J6E8V3_9EUKA|nr:Protein tyrosine kinase [Carpediemonas membranifera]|eukprot:KAG9392440.1 Protein tyrosine kinase [Carpediemonas membranifera]